MVLKTLAASLALLLLADIARGDLESVLERCCQTGESWARNHTTCTGPAQPPGPAQDRLSCLTSLYVCCVRAHRRVDCERGKEAARAGGLCGSEDSLYRDCCDGCHLGIQASARRLPCAFVRFSFGAPWDEAYLDCCERASSDQAALAQQQNRVVCVPGSPCSQVCDVVDNRIRCSCYPGFRLAADKATCEDIDECAQSQQNPCPGGGNCANTYGSFLCDYPFNNNKDSNPQQQAQQCPVGFVISQTNGRCVDVDECGEGLDSCNRSLQICQNSHGGYQCVNRPSNSKEDCPAGFKWNGNICQDVDECGEGLDDCDADKSCRNTVGGYECEAKCFPHMNFDPLQNKCVEKNACLDGLHDCKPDEVCISAMDDLIGYICLPKSGNNPCPPGFKPTTSQICEDINECEEFPDVCDGPDEVCINGIGSYDCVADNPASQQPPQACPLGYQYNEALKTCVDIDECLQGLDRCNRSTHNCVNHNGTHECVPRAPTFNRCPPGYRTDPRSNACEDINECSDGRHKCLPGKEQCVNVPGAYRCQPITCPPGHRFNASTGACRDVDECSEGSHSCNEAVQNCVNAIGSFRCVNKASCPYGYRLLNNKCEDVNECAENLDDCDRRNQNCVNTVGSYQCQSRAPQTPCGNGYIYDLSRNTCTDINECDVLKPCQADQTCENTPGSFVCKCPEGYVLDTVTRACKDLNECQLDRDVCGESQRCDNTIGSYTCVRTISCGTGYTLNAATSTCEDDDECLLNTHNCGPGFSCRNIQGSFRCDRVTCPPGQKLLTDGSCKVVVCAKGMEPDDAGNCIDINECARGNACRTNQFCVNTVGSYRCQNLMNCPAGYELNEFGSQCVDVDECARRLYECGAQQTCRNRPGGYTCECPRGYSLNLQRECEDIDECSRFRGQVCSRMSECINTQGSYVCNCKEGFRKADDDKNCVDIDECAESPNLCQQTCNNVWGSYQCSCLAGYTLGPDNRSCQDIDECKSYEGHGELCIGYCVNEPGSFSCSCPPGYRLSSDKRTCQDIDECQEQQVCSGDQEVCLNTRGSYKCNRIACPPNYVRDKDHRKDYPNSEDTVLCRKRCRNNDIACVLNSTQTITYQTISLPAIPRLPHPLILTTMRAVATRNDFGTDFRILEGNEEQLFDILKGQGVGSVRLTRAVEGPRDIWLRIEMTILMNPRTPFSSTSRHIVLLNVLVSHNDF